MNIKPIGVGALALLTAGCGSGVTPTASDTSSPPTVASVAPLIAAPRHIYDDRIKGTYYYITAVSDEEKKKGMASGEAIGFRYLGQNGDGEYIIGFVGNNGLVLGKAYCHNPCTVIRFNSGSPLGFTPYSVIGEAFTDAFHGMLKVSN